ncbi:hypothetical protein EJP77_17825 [Paenibacillus zeisoli]|uniref:Spore coat protein n=1 Tax=Paenibacillus zeisoli TaxID=2496267 RepID=A0A3S1BQR0_9BACL|nr:hypothetical protein [Paenibacillus zeisoli]RUT28470.1 hypothetical protein EJP77_17825 [Paenibacillus zeisoli]
MNPSSLQPLTTKELNYIADSIMNEDLLIKQSAAAAAVSQNANVQQALSQYISTHQQHLQLLTDTLKEHQALAPNQVQ